MQYRVYDRQKIAYIDGGYVADFDIDDDYIVNNNTTISIIKPTTAQVGDIIALIQTTGAYHKGVITEVDNSALKISYKSDKELFNDNFPNPFSAAFSSELNDSSSIEVSVAGRFGISVVAAILQCLYLQTPDKFKRLPITMLTEGDVVDDLGNVKMLWTWQDTSIKMVDWLVELFEKYNVVLKWTIDFDIAQETLSLRAPQYIVTLSAITNKGNLIKDNVAMQTITYTGEQLPEQTVCVLIDSSTKAAVENGKFYLCQNENGEYYVSEDVASTERMLPVKTTFVEYDTSDSEDKPTKQESAEDVLIPSKYNQAVEIKINADSKMFDFGLASFGDEYVIMGKYLDELMTNDNSIQGKQLIANYTGRKQSSKDNYITLYFGLGRKTYTDLIQIRMRKQRYHSIYGK